MGAIAEGLRRVLELDRELWHIVALSLEVSLSAVLIATVLGLPLGAALAVKRFAGRRALIVLLNALMGLPPVVVGLLIYLLLSRAGPLGELGLLFTPGAMIIAPSDNRFSHGGLLQSRCWLSFRESQTDNPHRGQCLASRSLRSANPHRRHGFSRRPASGRAGARGVGHL